MWRAKTRTRAAVKRVAVNHDVVPLEQDASATHGQCERQHVKLHASAAAAHLARLFLNVQLEMTVASACACALANRSNTPTPSGRAEASCSCCVILATTCAIHTHGITNTERIRLSAVHPRIRLRETPAAKLSSNTAASLQHHSNNNTRCSEIAPTAKPNDDRS